MEKTYFIYNSGTLSNGMHTLNNKRTVSEEVFNSEFENKISEIKADSEEALINDIKNHLEKGTPITIDDKCFQIKTSKK